MFCKTRCGHRALIGHSLGVGGAPMGPWWFHTSLLNIPLNGRVVRGAGIAPTALSRGRKATAVTDGTQTESTIDLQLRCGTWALKAKR